MAKVILGTVIVVMLTAPVGAQMMTGYSVDVLTGIVTAFSCEEHGDPDCFRVRTELGTIPASMFSWVPATTLAPTGELVVGHSASGERWLHWLELPSLDVVRSLQVNGTISIEDIAFGPDGTLWLTSSKRLYTIDLGTGQAAEVWSNNSGARLTSIAFVGERMFLSGGYQSLLEYMPATGDVRLVADYYSQNLMISSMSALDDRLWSLSFHPTYPPGPPALMDLAVHDLENGDRDVVVPGFDYAPGGEPWPEWTLDFTQPDQPQQAIPATGPVGLAVLVVLTAIGGWLLIRRRG